MAAHLQFCTSDRRLFASVGIGRSFNGGDPLVQRILVGLVCFSICLCSLGTGDSFIQMEEYVFMQKGPNQRPTGRETNLVRGQTRLDSLRFVFAELLEFMFFRVVGGTE